MVGDKISVRKELEMMGWLDTIKWSYICYLTEIANTLQMYHLMCLFMLFLNVND